MAEDERIEERKQFNANFLRAFDVLKNEKNTTQDVLARMLSTNSSYISACRKGEKKVGTDLMERLARAFNGRLNMRFLRNESQYMLLANVPDEEKQNESNPDYPILKQQKEARANQIQMAVLGHLAQQPTPAHGNTANDEEEDSYMRLPTWADTLLRILSKQIAENESLHAELKQSNAELKQSIADVKEMQTKFDKLIQRYEILLQKKI